MQTISETLAKYSVWVEYGRAQINVRHCNGVPVREDGQEENAVGQQDPDTAKIREDLRKTEQLLPRQRSRTTRMATEAQGGPREGGRRQQRYSVTNPAK